MSQQSRTGGRLESTLWPALTRYWHPIGLASELGERPLSKVLLGERIVLWRLDGAVACFRDLCVHRGTPLSLGWVEEDGLVCAYHGWKYDVGGRCIRIPALPKDRPVPDRARAEAFRVTEQYGLLWVCLGDPVVDVPAFPEYGSPGFSMLHFPAKRWRCSAARQTENTVDQAHFPWVHEGILGDRDHPETAEFEIERHDEELRFAYEDRPNPMHPTSHQRVYRLHRPFTVHQRKERAGGESVEASFSVVSPVSERESVGFLIIARNFRLSEDEERARFELDRLIQEQDQPIVESQRPEELPLDLAAELHVKGPDSVAVAYRRFIGELGVEV